MQYKLLMPSYDMLNLYFNTALTSTKNCLYWPGQKFRNSSRV